MLTRIICNCIRNIVNYIYMCLYQGDLQMANYGTVSKDVSTSYFNSIISCLIHSINHSTNQPTIHSTFFLSINQPFTQSYINSIIPCYYIHIIVYLLNQQYYKKYYLDIRFVSIRCFHHL